MVFVNCRAKVLEIVEKNKCFSIFFPIIAMLFDKAVYFVELFAFIEIEIYGVKHWSPAFLLFLP